ncbi:MAG TPA: MFS transporter, partial [bacterium]
FAMLTGQGLLVILAGYIESHSGLESVDLSVASVQQTTQQQVINPDSLIIEPLEGELRIVALPERLEILTVQRRSEEIKSLVKQAQKWNSAQLKLNQQVETSETGEQNSQPSWWQRAVVQNIENAIRNTFGTTKKVTPAGKMVGNAGVIYFYLSKQPETGKKVILNFGRESGDKSFALVEGGRAEFTNENWNRPLMAVIQIDPKLSKESSANFVARAGNIPLSWIVTFFFMAGLFALFAIYHRVILPYPAADVSRKSQTFQSFLKDFGNTFVLFFKKKKIGLTLAFLLLYRLGESQLVKLASPFLLDTQETGGLGLTTGQVGFVYGTVGIALLTCGGLLGGFLAARHGLKKWILWMAIAINLPDIVYLYLAQTQTTNFFIINICVGIEQLGYGFGFTAYMLYMILVSEGEYKTAHFAITTGFMALGMMIPGMISGWIQSLIGYPNFFIWVLISTIPGIILVKLLPIDAEFGKKKNE